MVSRFLTRTLGIAVATSVSLAGVQVISQQSGITAPALAVAETTPSASTLDGVDITTTVVSQKSGAAAPASGSTVDLPDKAAYNKYTKDVGWGYKATFAFAIPDSAKAGDTVVLKFKDNFQLTSGDSQATEVKDPQGNILGTLKRNLTQNTITFTLGEKASNQSSRKVEFNALFSVSPNFYGGIDKNKVGTTENHQGSIVRSTAQGEKSVYGFKYALGYVDNGNGGNYLYNTPDFTLGRANQQHDWKWVADSTSGKVRTMRGQKGIPFAQIGARDSSGTAIEPGHVVYEDTNGDTRDVVIEYTLSDPSMKFIESDGEPRVVIATQIEKAKLGNNPEYPGYYDMTGNANKQTVYIKNDGSTDLPGEMTYHFAVDKGNSSVARITLGKVPRDASVQIYNAFGVEAEYKPGKKLTMTGSFVNGVGKPDTAYDVAYEKTRTLSYTIDKFDELGNSETKDPNASFEVLVGGKEADSINTAVPVERGSKVDFTVRMTNTGGETLDKVTIKLPEGVSTEDGLNGFEHTFANGGLKPGKTEEFVIPKLSVGSGPQPNEFQATIAGVPKLTDYAWTMTSMKDIFIDGVEGNKTATEWILHRNDDETFTINLAPLADRIAALEDAGHDVDGLKKDIDDIKDKIADLEKKDQDLDTKLADVIKKITNLTVKLGDMERDIATLKQLDIKEVKNNGDGTYTIIRNNGEAVPGTIKVGNTSGIKDIATSEGGLVITMNDGSSKTIPISDITVTETAKGTPQHQINFYKDGEPLVGFNAFDYYITAIDRTADGKYQFYRSDKTDGPWETIDLSGIINDIEELKKADTNPAQIADLEKRVGDIEAGLTELKIAVEKNAGDITTINEKIVQIGDRLDALTLITDNLKAQDIAKIVDNGDGTYSLIRNNGTAVEGLIGDGGVVHKIIDNQDGTISFIHKDGTVDTIAVSGVTVTEENKGTPEHTVTITYPGAEPLTFSVADTYITDVVKNDKGDYDIYRNDIGEGKTVWKTIKLSDITERLAQVEKRVADSEEHDAKVDDELKRLKDRMDGIVTELESLKGVTGSFDERVAALESQVFELGARLDLVDVRLDIVENRLDNVENKVEGVDNKVDGVDTKVDTYTKAAARCVNGLGSAIVPLVLSVPVLLAAHTSMPGVEAWNTQIQKSMGVYNPEMAKWMAEHKDVIATALGIVGFMGVLGLVGNQLGECKDYGATDAMKNTELGSLLAQL